MRRLFQHGGKAEKFSMRRLINNHILVILVHRRHPHFSGDHDVSLVAGISNFINALAGGEIPEFDLPCQYCHFFLIQ